MTPVELTYLRQLRRRGQAPELAVFVTDDWRFADRITDEIGSMMIRVRSITDLEHDWSPIAGLWVILWFARATEQQAKGAAALMLAQKAQRVWYLAEDRLRVAA